MANSWYHRVCIAALVAAAAHACDARSVGRTEGAGSAWEAGSPSELPRVEAAAAVVDGRLIIAGGFATPELNATTRVDAYDPESDSWSRLRNMPVALTHANFALSGRTLWLAGGFVGDHPGPATRDVWKFDLTREEWSRGPSLPMPRGAGALVALDNSLHYFGGFHPDRDTNAADHWVLRLPAEEDAVWTPAAPLPEARGQLGGVQIDGKIYAVGGQFHHDSAPGPTDVDFVHEYDPRTDRWRRVASLPRARSHAEGSTFVHRGRIVVAGGRNLGAGRQTVQDVTQYDPVLDVWLALPPLPKALLGPAAGSMGSRMIVHGGSDIAWHSPQPSVWWLSLHGTWERHGQMPVPLAEAAAGIIGNGLYVIGQNSPATLRYDLSRADWANPTTLSYRPYPGGQHTVEVWNDKLYVFGGSGRAAGRTQIYDPSTDSWALGADMPFEARTSVSALIDQRIFVAGGMVGDFATSRVASYDPADDEWSVVADMPVSRSDAAGGTDGSRLYVFGGRGATGTDGDVGTGVFADVQVYDPAADEWTISSEEGSPHRPLPRATGGTGKAVFVGGEFYVLGGMTSDEPDAGGACVSDRVDIYDPRTNRWRIGPALPTARRGAFPVTIAERIYVAAGDEDCETSGSPALEVLSTGPPR